MSFLSTLFRSKSIDSKASAEQGLANDVDLVSEVPCDGPKLGRPDTIETYDDYKETDDNRLRQLESLDSAAAPVPWEPSGSPWRDFFYFCGPGWFVSIAYVDPGNYQADIKAGSSSRYTLLFALWWSCALSVYVQVLCVRLAYIGQITLAEAQARDSTSRISRYTSWAIAELSAMVADLPEVIGIGIAMNQFFGWPYYAGVLLSLVTTMIFLATMHLGVQILERIVFFFVAVMSLSLWFEMGVVNPNGPELLKGWVYGFVNVQPQDLFSIAGILGSVVMPHNLYLHTAAIQSRRVKREEPVVRKAVKYASFEPTLPMLLAFIVNTAVITIASERVYGDPNAENAGLTDFCTYFEKLKGGCYMWGIALLASGQSSAITTTFTGQYVMDGFLNMQLPVRVRAVITRLIAIVPCVIVSIVFNDRVNQMVSFVNASISLLLPFAFCPLVKYNCSDKFLGTLASKGLEKYMLHGFALAVWAINAYAFSSVGGGFFGDFVRSMPPGSMKKVLFILLEVAFQVFYAWWNLTSLFKPVQFQNRSLDDERPHDPQFASTIANRH